MVLSHAHKQFRRGPYSVFGVVTGREDRDDKHLALETQLHNHPELHQHWPYTITQSSRVAPTLAIFTLETDYPLDNSRQTDNTSLFQNRTDLIFDGQSAWLYPSVFFFRQFWRILKMDYPSIVWKRPLSLQNVWGVLFLRTAGLRWQLETGTRISTLLKSSLQNVSVYIS